MLRPVAINRYLSLMQKRGFDADLILAGSGVRNDNLSDPDFLVEPMQCRVVVSNMLRISGDDGIGFDAGLNSPLQSLGVVGQALLSCKAIRETHSIWIRFGESLSGIMGKVNIVAEDANSASLEFLHNDLRDPLLSFYVEEFLGLMKMCGSGMSVLPFIAKRAEFAYRAPLHDHRYHDLLNCPIRFDTGRTVISVGRDWLEQTFQSVDEEFNRICLQHCEDMLRRLEGKRSIINALRTVFLRAKNDFPQLHEAASALNMSSRTLSRLLEKEGTSYRKQVDLYRVERVTEYLKQGISIKEMSFMLGYSDPSAFRHSFRMWTGKTVSEYRDQVLSGTLAPFQHH